MDEFGYEMKTTGVTEEVQASRHTLNSVIHNGNVRMFRSKQPERASYKESSLKGRARAEEHDQKLNSVISKAFQH